MGSSQFGQGLSDKEVNQITAFLTSLTGKMPVITYPILPAETAATPRPTGEVKPM